MRKQEGLCEYSQILACNLYTWISIHRHSGRMDAKLLIAPPQDIFSQFKWFWYNCKTLLT